MSKKHAKNRQKYRKAGKMSQNSLKISLNLVNPIKNIEKSSKMSKNQEKNLKNFKEPGQNRQKNRKT